MAFPKFTINTILRWSSKSGALAAVCRPFDDKYNRNRRNFDAATISLLLHVKSKKVSLDYVNILRRLKLILQVLQQSSGEAREAYELKRVGESQILKMISD